MEVLGYFLLLETPRVIKKSRGLTEDVQSQRHIQKDGSSVEWHGPGMTQRTQQTCSRPSVLVSHGCCNKHHKLVDLETRDTCSLTVLEAKSLKQDVNRVGSLRSFWGRNHPRSLSELLVFANNLWHHLACRCIVPVSALTFTWPFLCAFPDFLPLTGTTVIGSGPTLSQCDLILISIHCFCMCAGNQAQGFVCAKHTLYF